MGKKSRQKINPPDFCRVGVGKPYCATPHSGVRVQQQRTVGAECLRITLIKNTRRWKFSQTFSRERHEPRGDSCPRLSSRALLDRPFADRLSGALFCPDSRGQLSPRGLCLSNTVSAVMNLTSSVILKLNWRPTSGSTLQSIVMPIELRRLSFVQFDVFSARPFEGNSLAVVPDARGLSDQMMQALAREMNLSETTFVLPRDPATERERGVRVRIFTVQEELPFAGHPTLGTRVLPCGVRPVQAKLLSN